MTAELVSAGEEFPRDRGILGSKPFSPETLAERWDCSAEKVRQMVHRGELPGFRLGKLIRIKAIEVERYECAQTLTDMNSSNTGKSSPSRSDEAKIAADTRRALMTLVSRT